VSAATSVPFGDGAEILQAGAVVLYGAGQVGRDVCGALLDAGVHVVSLLDRAPREGSSYRGVPIQSVDACPIPVESRGETPLVISIFNRDVDVPAVAASLRTAGFATIVPFVRLHARFADALGDRFWLTDASKLEAAVAEIARAERVFADDTSREVFRALIALRHGEYRPEANPRNTEMQYLPSDVPEWNRRDGSVRFVDCGAFRGDTLEQLLDAGVPIEASAHFEPDTDNFDQLVRVVRARVESTGRPASSWPCAVGKRSGVVSFQQGSGEASRVSAEGSATVPVVALDDVLVGWHPTLVKMDIEGSEIEALEGARRLLEADRPRLAVCVYHRPDHLWRIPLLLSSWRELDGYSFYLRSHGFNGFDTVLYANPDERGRHHSAFDEVRV
jgi:FkbM family methyltransferase